LADRGKAPSEEEVQALHLQREAVMMLEESP